MSIPESQLDSWSHQGSITQSSDTYNTIKNVLESAGSPYADKSYDVFLQGSYGNNTNIFAESDVDIVIKFNGAFFHDLNALPADQRVSFQATFQSATYTHVDFKKDVIDVLKAKYGNAVQVGDKAIAIAANGGRRKADVIACVQYRRYYKFLGLSNQEYDEGICFFTGSDVKIANYPKQHSANLTRKHQDTQNWFKPMVRILKNLRGKLIDEQMIEAGVAPSYYLEGLLYNVPNDMFTTSYQDSLINCINWIARADRSKFLCANEQYHLLWEDSPVTWRASKCEEFLSAAIKLWNEW